MPPPASTAPDLAAHTVPEFGQLEGFAPPRVTASLGPPIGHEKALATLQAARQQDRLHHAWLITGPLGIGKATLAYHFAGQLLNDPHAARQIASSTHPNLRCLSRPFNEKTKKFAAAIPVAEIRQIKAFLAATAAQEGYRVVLVDQADDLNVSAANALLKMLEEPPELTVFMLISSEPGRLLPTIRSRCRTLALSPLAPPALEKALLMAYNTAHLPPPEGEALAQIMALSHGRPRRALEMSTDSGRELMAQLLGIFSALPALDYRQVHALADKVTIAGAERDFEMLITLLLDLIHRLIRSMMTKDPNEQAGLSAQAPLAALERPLSRLKDPGSMIHWADLWRELVKENQMTAALNLDKRNFLIFCFDRLHTTARQTMG